MSDTLKQLEVVLEQRKSADAGESYVASLHAEGINKILEKVGEEATEAILAAKDLHGVQSLEKPAEHGESPDALAPQLALEVIKETADLWFHTLVMLSHLDLSHEQVLEELEKRFKLSGLAEKASRQK